jgi:hypothetical protein
VIKLDSIGRRTREQGQGKRPEPKEAERHDAVFPFWCFRPGESCGYCRERCNDNRSAAVDVTGCCEMQDLVGVAASLDSATSPTKVYLSRYRNPSISSLKH